MRRILELWGLEVGLEPIPLTPEGFAERAERITGVWEAVRTGKEIWP